MNPRPLKEHLLTEIIGGECVVYDTRTKKAHTLNTPVAWVWRHCDGQTSTDKLISMFQQEFGTNGTDIVNSSLDQLRAAELLEVSSEEVISRRAVVAAGAALTPMITSILVPTARAAKSDNPGKGKGGDGGNDGKGKGKGK